jgi:hypothetical protein
MAILYLLLDLLKKILLNESSHYHVNIVNVIQRNSMSDVVSSGNTALFNIEGRFNIDLFDEPANKTDLYVNSIEKESNDVPKERLDDRDETNGKVAKQLVTCVFPIR